MEIDDHVPSLTHLREFTRARINNRNTHVAQDRLQVTAPSDNRFFAYAYEKFLTAVLAFVSAGNRGSALQRAAAESSDHMRRSYEECAKAMTRLLSTWKPFGVRRRQKNIIVLDVDGYAMVSLRIHLVFETADGPVAAFVHFPEQRLTDAELAIIDTAVALAAREIDPGAMPAIIMARTGLLRLVDAKLALRADCVAFLRRESVAYRTAWAEAA